MAKGWALELFRLCSWFSLHFVVFFLSNQPFSSQAKKEMQITFLFIFSPVSLSPSSLSFFYIKEIMHMASIYVA